MELKFVVGATRVGVVRVDAEAEATSGGIESN